MIDVCVEDLYLSSLAWKCPDLPAQAAAQVLRVTASWQPFEDPNRGFEERFNASKTPSKAPQMRLDEVGKVSFPSLESYFLTIRTPGLQVFQYRPSPGSSGSKKDFGVGEKQRKPLRKSMKYKSKSHEHRAF